MQHTEQIEGPRADREIFGIEWWAGKTVKEIEIEVISLALMKFKGHRTNTAESLGIPIRSFRNKLKRYGFLIRPYCFSKNKQLESV